jgi:four helix bundle protein
MEPANNRWWWVRGITYLGGVTTFPDPPGFAEWEATVPASFKRDPIWRTPAYRYGLWIADLAKRDARVLRADRDSRNDADQLLRAVEAISSNLAEGYGRSTGAERARYYDYAVASTRESRDWYFKSRDVLGIDVMEHRHAVLERIIRILTAIIPRERADRSRRRPRPKPEIEHGREDSDYPTDGFGTGGSS